MKKKEIPGNSESILIKSKCLEADLTKNSYFKNIKNTTVKNIGKLGIMLSILSFTGCGSDSADASSVNTFDKTNDVNSSKIVDLNSSGVEDANKIGDTEFFDNSDILTRNDIYTVESENTIELNKDVDLLVDELVSVLTQMPDIGYLVDTYSDVLDKKRKFLNNVFNIPYFKSVLLETGLSEIGYEKGEEILSELLLKYGYTYDSDILEAYNGNYKGYFYNVNIKKVKKDYNIKFPKYSLDGSISGYGESRVIELEIKSENAEYRDTTLGVHTTDTDLGGDGSVIYIKNNNIKKVSSDLGYDKDFLKDTVLLNEVSHSIFNSLTGSKDFTASFGDLGDFNYRQISELYSDIYSILYSNKDLTPFVLESHIDSNIDEYKLITLFYKDQIEKGINEGYFPELGLNGEVDAEYIKDNREFFSSGKGYNALLYLSNKMKKKIDETIEQINNSN